MGMRQRNRKLSMGALVACACLVGVAFQSPVNRITSFKSLASGTERQIRFQSIGCFSQQTYQLRVRERVLSVYKVAADERIPAKFGRDKAEFVGSVQLSDRELAGLDALIAFYRSNPSSNCTTVDSISITDLHNDKPIAQESFTDGSCSYGNPNAPKVPVGTVWLQELIERARKGV
jgi:hypothetical protein